MEEAELRYWLALSRAPGLGARGSVRLLDRVGSPRELFENGASAIAGEVLKPETVAWLRSPDWGEIKSGLAWLDQPGHHLITIQDSRYSSLLRQISDPPPLLFVKGDPELLSLPQIAIVGSRNPSHSGHQTARDFARYLADTGLCITSGLAMGIDGAAHDGALAANGLTIAVAATGLDRVYPSRHRDLAHRIASQGALISEFPPGTSALRHHFPRRNRIISGLSLGVLVIEAAIHSGSLITARQAVEQGREVFAIPGSIHSPLARGCHALIRQGAKLVENAHDVVEELGPLLAHLSLVPDSESPVPAEGRKEWDGEYRLLLQGMDYDPTSVDLLIERTGLTAESVSSMLLRLELEGYVSPSPGGRYCLTGKYQPPSGPESLS
ncbi:MAG: DNA-protecting protein DprA [Gammaproteobacteria bacterium]|nr:DNA-protecting protein DprA [Gammaproteobacteria bacterium]